MIQHIIEMKYSQECSLLRVDPVHTFCHTMSRKSIIDDTTFSCGTIKKKERKIAKQNTLPVSRVHFVIIEPDSSIALVLGLMAVLFYGANSFSHSKKILHLYKLWRIYKWVAGLWTRLCWLGIGTGGGYLCLR